MTTASDIVTDAALAAGIGDQYNGLDTTSQGVALRAFNRLLQTWSNESLVVYNTSVDSFPMVAGQATYSSTLLAARPTEVLYAYVRQNNVDYPVDIIGDEDYARIGYKLTSGIPGSVWYNSAYPASSFTFFPVPSASSYTAFIGYRAPLVQIAALTDPISVPPGYEQAMVYGLATTLAPLFGTEPTPTCIYHAKSSKAAIKPQNESLNESRIGIPLGRGIFNIFMGN